MLLGIHICKNGRKFLHPDVKRAHFGHSYIIQRSKSWRQLLSRAVQLLLRPSDVQWSQIEMLSIETIHFLA